MAFLFDARLVGTEHVQQLRLAPVLQLEYLEFFVRPRAKLADAGLDKFPPFGVVSLFAPEVITGFTALNKPGNVWR